MTDACRLSRWAETYLDGELSPEHTVDFEDHLSDCRSCQERLKFEQALRFSVRRTVRVATYPSHDFESRMRAAMVGARDCATDVAEAKPALEPSNHAAPLVPLHPRPLTWRAIAPLSVAAAAALVFAAMRNEPTQPTGPGPTTAGMTSKDTMQTVRDFLDQLATDTEHHPDGAAALVEEGEPVFVTTRPPTIINVGQRRLPLPELKSLGAIWEGLHYRNLAMHGRTPSLHYRIGGHRVLLWAYDSERVPLRAVLQAQVARSQPVFVGTRQGLAIAAVERGSNGIAITTDLSTSEAAELAVTAAIH
jgi:hypothetical protein